MNLIPVIICGGAGSRLWPVSRTCHPKPFMTLPGGGNLIQKTFQRAASLEGVSEVLTVTNRDLFSRQMMSTARLVFRCAALASF